jgi:hypothetical protein
MFINSLKIMEGAEIGSFLIWSAITGIMMLVTGFAYGAYSKRNKIASS